MRPAPPPSLSDSPSTLFVPHSGTVLCMKFLRFSPWFTALILMLFCVVTGLPGASGQPAPSASQSAPSPQLVVLDTDIGDDIDDAFALALALQSPELKLLGITTAYGDTDLRARLVSR